MRDDRCRNCDAELSPQSLACAICGTPVGVAGPAAGPGARWDDVAGLLPEGVPRESSVDLEDRLHESLTRMRPPRPWERNPAAIAAVAALRAVVVGLVLAGLVALPALVGAAVDAVRGGGLDDIWRWLARIPVLWVAANGFAGSWYVAAGIAWTWLAFRIGATWAETRIWHLRVPTARRGIFLVGSAAMCAAVYWVLVFLLALATQRLLARTAGSVAPPVEGPRVPYLRPLGPLATSPLVAATGGAVVAFVTAITAWARGLRVSFAFAFGMRRRPAANLIAAIEGSRRFLLVALVAAMAYTVTTALAQATALVRGRFVSTAAVAGVLGPLLSLFVWFGLDAVVIELLAAMRLFTGSVAGVPIGANWYDIVLLGIVAVAFLLGGQAAARTLERPSPREGAVAGLGVGVLPGLLGAVFAFVHADDLGPLFVLTSLLCPMVWGAVFGAIGGYSSARRADASRRSAERRRLEETGSGRSGAPPPHAVPAPLRAPPAPPTPPVPPIRPRPPQPRPGTDAPVVWPDPGGPAVG